MTTPDWEPIMKISSGIITNKGGRTCHAAIVARELALNAIVGTGNATEILKKLSLIKIEEDDEGIEYGISIHRTLQKDAGNSWK